MHNDSDESAAAGVPRLGVVQMANVPLRYPGNLGNPCTFDYPVAYGVAPSAFTDRILQRDAGIADDYVRAALALQDRGAKALITTCGFNVVYQEQIARRLAVPVATSSLLLLPLVLRLISPARVVGVITFDEQQLDESLLMMAGVQAPDLPRLRILGLDGTQSWRELRQPHPDLSLTIIEDDLTRLVGRLINSEPALGAILLECSALCPFAPLLRGRFDLPVFDFVSLANFLHAAATDTKPFGCEGRALSNVETQHP